MLLLLFESGNREDVNGNGLASHRQCRVYPALGWAGGESAPHWGGHWECGSDWGGQAGFWLGLGGASTRAAHIGWGTQSGADVSRIGSGRRVSRFGSGRRQMPVTNIFCFFVFSPLPTLYSLFLFSPLHSVTCMTATRGSEQPWPSGYREPGPRR